MEPMPKLDRAAYVAGMREQLETMLGRVADAINDAKDGEIIAGSERRGFDLFAEFRRKAFEAGLQLRTDPAEGAFSPLGGRRAVATPRG